MLPATANPIHDVGEADTSPWAAQTPRHLLQCGLNGATGCPIPCSCRVVQMASERRSIPSIPQVMSLLPAEVSRELGQIVVMVLFLPVEDLKRTLLLCCVFSPLSPNPQLPLASDSLACPRC